MEWHSINSVALPQAHYETDTELVVGGQLLAIHLPGLSGQRELNQTPRFKEQHEVVLTPAAE